MNRLSDEDFVLYYYREAEDPQAIRRLLEESPKLQAQYEALRRTLDAAQEGFPVPARPDSYGAEVWRRLAPRLTEKRAPSPPAPFAAFRLSRLASLAAAAVALLAVGFLAGRLWRQPAGPRTIEAALPTAARDRILVSSVAAHLESSERLFTELANTSARGAVDVSAERRWARDLLAANRLYRQSTHRSGRPRLTTLLDELEPFLVELSHGPDEIPADELFDFRQRFEEQALLFKMRIVSQRLAGTKTL